MTIISLDISTDFEAPRPPKTPQSIGFRGLAVSLLVHGALIALVLWLSQSQSPLKTQNEQRPNIIDATLLIPSPVPKTETTVDAEESVIAEESNLEVPAQTSSSDEMTPTTTTQNAQMPVVEETPEDTPPDSPSDASDAAPTAAPSLSAQETSEDGQTRFNSSMEFTRRYFEQSAQNIANEEAARASQQYQAQQNSPLLYDTRAGEDEKEARPEIIVNCASVTNKAVTLLSGIGGGTLRCSDGGDPTGFIDARINKEPIKFPRNANQSRANR